MRERRRERDIQKERREGERQARYNIEIGAGRLGSLTGSDHVQNVIVRIINGMLAPKAAGEQSADTNQDGVVDENDAVVPSQAEDEVGVMCVCV